MSDCRTQRLRDPVHGLIVFRVDDLRDQLAWNLLDTPEFQRLRRIRQLGVSEFVFPSATHSRFAHCIGVFHTARQLADVIRRECASNVISKEREDVAVIAALLHDLGHGPFSHMFEEVQRSRGVKKEHEKWTAEIIRNPEGKIRPLLDAYGLSAHGTQSEFCDKVADLVEAEDPIDIYHAIVSSSFDADRFDYLRRDRLMTGTGAGAIDFDWLMEQVRVRDIDIEAPDAGDSEGVERIPTFCFDRKALPAAEQFLLARYTLHKQVYFHKTTRCAEHMIAKLLRKVAIHAQKQNSIKQTGLEKSNPLIRFFSHDGENLANYLALDDVVALSAIQQMQHAPDESISGLARRLHHRDLYKTLDLAEFGHDTGIQVKEARRISKVFESKIQNEEIIKDEKAKINIYSQIGGDDERAHKRIHILDGKDGPVEIIKLSNLIEVLLNKPKLLTRYYFERDEDREVARAKKGDHYVGT